MSSYAITGAARGIGQEFAIQLSADPKNLVFALVRTKNNTEQLQNLGRKNLHIIECDLLKNDQIQSAADTIAKITGGSLNVLIANAVAYSEGPSGNYTLNKINSDQVEELGKDILSSVDFAVVRQIQLVNAFLPLIRKGITKKIIFLGTGVADIPLTLGSEFPYVVPYSVSKAAAHMLAAKYAVALKSERIVVVTVSPGLVDTATKPPTPEEMAQFQTMVGHLKRVAPDFTGPITPTESVSKILKLIDFVGPELSGTVLSHFGSPTNFL